MAANPILVLGLGDTGARAIAQTKQRLQEVFGKKVPGVEFLAVLASDSVTRQSEELRSNLSGSLRSLIAMELSREAAWAEPEGKPSDVIGYLTPQWLGTIEIPTPGLVQDLTMIALEWIARNGVPEGIIPLLESRWTTRSRVQEINTKTDDLSNEQTASAVSEGKESAADRATAGIGRSELYRILQEKAVAEADRLIQDLSSKELSLGLGPYEAFLNRILVQMEKVIIPRVQGAIGKLRGESDGARFRILNSRFPASEAARRSIAELLAWEAFESAAVRVREGIRALLLNIRKCRQLAKAEIGSGADISLNLVGSHWELMSDYVRADRIAEMTLEFLKECGGSEGIANAPGDFHERLERFCLDHLSESLRTGLLLQSKQRAGSAICVLEPDEFRLISPEHDLDPSPADPGIKDRISHFGFSRKAVGEAFFHNNLFPELNRRLAEKIDDLTGSKAAIEMNSVLEPFRLTFDSGSVRIFVIADIGDTLGGALLQDFAGMAAQYCDQRNYGRRVTGILLAPKALVGDHRGAEPPAKAYATLKEICHWRSQHQYQHVHGSFGISVSNNLFDAVYIVESGSYDPEKAAEPFAASCMDFILMHMFDSQQQFGKVEDEGGKQEWPVLSFAIGRLVCPENAIRQLDAYSIAAEAAEWAAADGELIDREVATAAGQGPELREIIRRLKHGSDPRNRARAEIEKWWNQKADQVRQALDYGPIALRFPLAKAFIERMWGEVDALLGPLPGRMGNGGEGAGSDSEGDIRQLEERKRDCKRARDRFINSSRLCTAIAALAFFAGMILWIGHSTGSFVGTSLLVPVAALASLFMVCAIGAGVFHYLMQKKAGELREILRLSEKSAFELIYTPATFEYSLLRDLQDRIQNLDNQVTDLRRLFQACQKVWRQWADALGAALPFNDLSATEAGTVFLISKQFVDRHLETMKQELLGDLKQRGRAGNSPIEFSQLLGKPDAVVLREFPELIGRLAEKRERESLGVLSVLSDMAHHGESIFHFLSNLKLSAQLRTGVLRALVNRIPDSLDILALARLEDADMEPLAGVLKQAGIAGPAGQFARTLGADPYSIILCEVWDNPVEVRALSIIPHYYESYARTVPAELLSSEPDMLLRMEEIADVTSLDEVRKTVVKAIVLGLYSPPADPVEGIEELVEAMRVDRNRLEFLSNAIDEVCTNGAQNSENLRIWLDWVISKREWWSDKLGLVAPDLKAIEELMEEITSGTQRRRLI